MCASERTVKLLQAPLTGLPEGLAAESGLAESGLSEFGVPVQALAAEARLLAQPVSFETVSTSHHEGIEDRFTLAPLAARRLARDGLARASGSPRSSSSWRPRRSICAAGRSSARAPGPPTSGSAGSIPATGRGEPPPQDLEPIVALVPIGSVRRTLLAAS